jgi:hypothetical protein
VVERVHAGVQHVRILQQVPFGGEEGVGVATFERAPVAVVMQRVDIRGADIRIGAAVVVRVEVACLRILRGGFGLRYQGRLRGNRMNCNLPE